MLSRRSSSSRTIWIFGLLVVVLFLTINRHQWAADISNSGDDASYLSYALTLGLDFDLDFSNEPAYGISMNRDRRVPKHFYGAGVMAAPFVGLFSVIDRVAGHPVISDHLNFTFSFSYFGYSFAAHFFFWGAVLLVGLTARQLGTRLSPTLVLLLVASSGVFYYVAIRSRMTHSFELFGILLALFGAVWASRRFRDGEGTWPPFFFAALGAHIALAVRGADFNVLALPLLVPVFLASIRWIRKEGLLKLIVRQAVTIILVALPFAAINIAIYGTVLLMPTGALGGVGGMQNFDQVSTLLSALGRVLSGLPFIAHIFFGGEFGLLWSSPVVPIGLGLGIWMILSGRPGALKWISLLALLAYCGFSLAINILTETPASSYGWRYLYPLFGPTLLAVLIWWQRIGNLPVLDRSVKVALILLACFSLSGQMLFSKNEHLSYTTGWADYQRKEVARAPQFIPNLAAEMVRGRVWDTARKDSFLGYLQKPFKRMINGKYTREENPAMVGTAYLFIGLLWFFAIRMCWRLRP